MPPCPYIAREKAVICEVISFIGIILATIVFIALIVGCMDFCIISVIPDIAFAISAIVSSSRFLQHSF